MIRPGWPARCDNVSDSVLPELRHLGDARKRRVGTAHADSTRVTVAAVEPVSELGVA